MSLSEIDGDSRLNSSLAVCRTTRLLGRSAGDRLVHCLIMSNQSLFCPVVAILLNVSVHDQIKLEQRDIMRVRDLLPRA